MIRIDPNLIQKGLGELGIATDPTVAEAFSRYAELLVRWNRTYNLTAIREEGEVLTHHLFDSAALVPQIGKLCPEARTVLDVGSGGGLPAVPIAILRPDLQVLAVDAVGKKSAFINQAAIELGLRNLRARHARVETLQGKMSFDVVTSRAFATLDDFTRLTRGLLTPYGKWLAMKGVHPKEEVDALGDFVVAEAIVRLEVPGLEAERHAVLMRPTHLG